MPQRQVLEARSTTAQATPVDGAPGRFLVELITPGWGSSGYYSPEVLEAAAGAGVFPAGTHMYLDHPAADGSGQDMHGNRTLRDLAAVLDESATWNGSALVCEALVFGNHRHALEQMRESIGVSVRALAEVEQGEAEGRTGTIVRSLVESPQTSADFVTHGGRGGRIVDVIESAPPAAVVRSAIAHGVAEATANDTREALQQQLRDTYGAEQSWVWVRDFDGTTVWYEHETPEESGTYAEAYSLDDAGAVTLAGEREEVRARTEYVPVNPAGRTTTTESEEDTMPQIEESRLRQLEADAGRVQTLESERDAAVQRAETAETERDQARGTIAESTRTSTIARIIDEAAEAAHVELDDDQRAGIATRAVVSDEGVVDESATRTAFDTRVAAIAERQGAGTPSGVGKSTTTSTESGKVAGSFEELDQLQESVFGATLQEA